MSIQENLRNALFLDDDDERAFAIVDGAACDDLLDQLAEHEPDSCCLYPGELEPDVEALSPYLIALEKDHPFTEWLIANLPGKPWGILVRANATLRQLRKHFRAFLNVKNEQGENLYFRYYDPRVLRLFLPTCDTEQLETLFAPVTTYFAEIEAGAFMTYRYEDGKLLGQKLA